MANDKKIVYSEPSEYIPEELRKKYKMKKKRENFEVVKILIIYIL